MPGKCCGSPLPRQGLAAEAAGPRLSSKKRSYPPLPRRYWRFWGSNTPRRVRPAEDNGSSVECAPPLSTKLILSMTRGQGRFRGREVRPPIAQFANGQRRERPTGSAGSVPAEPGSGVPDQPCGGIPTELKYRPLSGEERAFDTHGLAALVDPQAAAKERQLPTMPRTRRMAASRPATPSKLPPSMPRSSPSLGPE